MFQGWLKTFGSSSVAVYSMVFASRNFQRSTTCSASLWKLPARSSHVSVVEVLHVDDERVAFPPAARVAEPELVVGDFGMQRAVRVDRAHRVAELKHERQVAVALEDLERLGVVDAARRAERPALEARVCRCPVRRSCFFFCSSAAGR